MTTQKRHWPTHHAPEIGVATLLPARGYTARYTPERDLVGFAFETQTGSHAFGSDRAKPFRARPNSLAFTPAGCDIYSNSTTGGEYLTVALEPAKTSQTARQFTDVVAPAMIAHAHLIRRFLLGAPSVDPLEAEAALAALAGATTARTEPTDAERWMTARRLAQIDAFIDAHLGDAISVADLAAALQLSAGFLTRSLRGALGVTPHCYIIDRRLAFARRQIEGSAEPLAEIAVASGFASQAHMTSQMKKRLGVTPGALRRL